MLNACTDIWIREETVQYVRRPGNTLDRNIEAYQQPPPTADVLSGQSNEQDGAWTRAVHILQQHVGSVIDKRSS